MKKHEDGNVLAVPALFFTGVLFSIACILPFYANLAIGVVSLGFFVYSFLVNPGPNANSLG